MLFAEPPRSPYDLNFYLFGFPVRISPWFWGMGIILSITGSRNPSMAAMMVDLIAWLLALLISITVHELGHAFMQRFYGYSPSIVLYGFGGLAIPGHHNGRRYPGSLANVLISLAGPFAGFALGGGIFGLLMLERQFNPDSISIVQRFPLLYELVANIIYISIFWGVLNLLPIYPLDGGHVSREVCLKINRMRGLRWSLILSMFVAALIAVRFLLVWAQAGSHGFPFAAMLFGYLAYQSYQILQHYTIR